MAYQIDPLHRGATRGPALKLPLRIAWSRDLGQYVSFPLMLGGQVIASAGDTLQALDASSGSRIWSRRAPSGSSGWVGAAYDVAIYSVLSEPEYSAPSLFAISPQNGEAIWKVALPRQAGFSSPPAAANGMVFASSDAGEAYGLNSSGALQWAEGVKGGSDTVPAVSSDGIYFAYACAQTYKFDPATGILIWRHKAECSEAGGSAPVVANDLVFVRGRASGYEALHANDGTSAGRLPDAAFPPAVAGRRAFIVQFDRATGVRSKLTALNATTFQKLWSIRLAGGDSFQMPALAVGSPVYAASTNGFLYAYDATNGTVVTTLNLGASTLNYGPSPIAMAYDEGLLVVPVGTKLVAVAGPS